MPCSWASCADLASVRKNVVDVMAPEARHRDRISPRIFPFNACVAQPVSRKEVARIPAAKAAMKVEWDRLFEKKVWDIDSVKEWDDVAAKARREKETVDFGYVFGICVLKNAELPEGSLARKYKGRVVFQGNRVVNQNWETAIFQDLGSAPATMEAGRAADCYGCMPDHEITIADAEQAYIQAELKGNPTWVALPPEAWPAQWRGKFRHPVVRLKKALYGHPHSGSHWEEHCDERVKSAGFEPVGPSWPSCYFHPKMKLFLVIYVDDFKLAGPRINIEQGWKLLRRDLNIEPHKTVGVDGTIYLGCALRRGTVRLPDGKVATSLSYDMGSFLKKAVQKYLALAGPGTTFRHVETPFLPEDQAQSPQGAPVGKGACVECPGCKHTFAPVDCPWCKHTFAPTVYDDVKRLDVKRKGIDPKASHGKEGRLQPIAAKILMTVLYAARDARLDLLRPICHLACYITRWTSDCDRKLHRLMCYIHSSYHLQMVGWVGDKPEDVQPFLFADADFAGCTETQRSTTGYYLAIRGPRTCFPITGVSKRQNCVSHSTPEAETVATDFCLRHCGLPNLDLWHTVLPHKPCIMFFEDNQAMIRVIETGKNPTMRYLHRTHRVSVAWLHEVFKGDHLRLMYEISARMAADIFTKAFSDKV